LRPTLRFHPEKRPFGEILLSLGVEMWGNALFYDFFLPESLQAKEKVPTFASQSGRYTG